VRVYHWFGGVAVCESCGCGEKRRRRGIIEVDVDVERMVGDGVGVAFAEAMAHFAVGRADVVRDEVAEEEVGVVHFGEFWGGEVLQESGAFADNGRDASGCAHV
jgi:hypothetical protein